MALICRWENNEFSKVKNMDISTLEPFPPAARRWLEHVLPDRSVVPSRIRISQVGEMDIRGNWTPFSAEGIYQGSPLSFNWKARLAMLRGVWITAEDGHANGQGWGGARLWGFLPMGRRTDPEVLTTQLVRNIGELAWLPELALSDPELEWRDAGDNAFEIYYRAGETDALVRFEINDEGDITQATSPSRPYDISGGYAHAPWHYQFSEHRNFNQVRLPAKAVATYERGDGPWEYFHGQITAVNRETNPI